MSKLHEAVLMGNFIQVQNLLKKDATIINDLNSEFQSPLCMVYEYAPIRPLIDEDRLKLMKLLIDFGANVNVRSGENSTTLLHKAILRKKFNDLQFLLENKADPSISDIYGNTVMHYLNYQIIGIRNLKVFIELFLKYGADINSLNLFNQTPLDYVYINNNKLQVAETFMEYGAKMYDFYSSLMKLFSKSYVNEYQVMFTFYFGPKMDPYNKFSHQKLLKYVELQHDPYWNCFAEKIQLLTTCYRDITEKLPLHEAVATRNEIEIKNLLNSGVDVNLKDEFDNTPLHMLFAKREGNNSYDSDEDCMERITHLLIDNGANYKAENYIGFTLFHFAMKIGSVKIIDLLIFKLTGEIGLDFIADHTSEELKSVSDTFIHDRRCPELVFGIHFVYEDVVDILIDPEIEKPTREHPFGKEKSHFFFNRFITDDYDIVRMSFETDLQTDAYYHNYLFSWYEVTGSPAYFASMLKIMTYIIEYEKERKMIKQAWRYIQTRNSKQNYTNENLTDFDKLVIFYYALDFQLNRVPNDLLPLKSFFKTNETFSNVLITCNNVLDKLKQEYIFEKSNITIFKILSMRYDSLTSLLSNPEVFEASKEFILPMKTKSLLEPHETVLYEKLSLAIERIELLQSAKDILNEAFEAELLKINYKNFPDFIILNILTRLSSRDLRRIALDDTTICTLTEYSDSLELDYPQDFFREEIDSLQSFETDD